jgi:hypothetical protein
VRLAIPLALVLAATASRDGCGNGARSTPYDPCAGKACGEACRTCAPDDGACVEPALPPAFATVCDPHGACVPVDVMAAGGSGAAAAACSHPDCVGKACGEDCNPCGPGGTCPTLIPSACDRDGRCAGKVPWLCYDPCAGKSCGEPCHLCPPDATDCAETAVVKACDPGGRCVTQTPSLGCTP